MSQKTNAGSTETIEKVYQPSPSTKAYLKNLEGRPVLNSFPAAEARRLYRANSSSVTPRPLAVESVQDLQIEGPHGPFGLRLYRPAHSRTTEALPVFIYIHGGGWVLGDLETHDALCRQFCNQAQCAVLSVDYHLAPEHRFPAAVDDCIVAAAWTVKHGSEFHLDTSRMAIGGDSAGGNLAAVVALDSALNRGPEFKLQLLLYPATDHAMTAPSHTENAHGYFLTRDLGLYFRDHYVDAKDFENWKASPAKAKSHKGVAPALIITAGFDPFRDEGREYAALLEAAGVPVTHTCYHEMIHGFMRLGKVIPEAQIAIDEAARALAQALGTQFQMYPSESPNE